MFTKQHYIAIAKIVKETQDGKPGKTLTQKLCDFFANDNPKFDKKQFAKACIG